MKLTPATNYISLEREFIGESDSFKIQTKYFGFEILWVIFAKLSNVAIFGSSKNFKLLKFRHVVYHFKARDLDNQIYSLSLKIIFKYRENMNNTIHKAFLKSRNLIISQNKLHISNLQIRSFKMIYNLFMFYELATTSILYSAKVY